MGLRAGFDPLKEQNAQQAMSRGQNMGAVSLTSRVKEQSQDSKNIYAKLTAYCTQNKIIDQMCDAFGQKKCCSWTSWMLEFLVNQRCICYIQDEPEYKANE